MQDNTQALNGRLPNSNEMVFLAFILVAGPLAWFVDLLLKFALASNACLNPNPSDAWFYGRWTYAIIDLVAIGIAAWAAWESYRSWDATRAGRHLYSVSEAGENRQHFLALWGMLIGVLFISSIMFSLVADLAVPPCTS